jgi:hypothetical protein
MQSAEMSFDTRLVSMYQMLALARTVNPANPEGLAPSPETFYTRDPERSELSGIVGHAHDLEKLTSQQIYSIGVEEYDLFRFAGRNVRRLTGPQIEEQSSVLAVLTVPSNDHERRNRANLFQCVLRTLSDMSRHHTDRDVYHEVTDLPTSPGPLDRNRPLHVIPDRMRSLGDGLIGVHYHAPGTTRRRYPVLAVNINSRRLIELADRYDSKPSTAVS